MLKKQRQGASAMPQWLLQLLQHLRNQVLRQRANSPGLQLQVQFPPPRLLLHQARRQLIQLLPQVLPNCLVTW